MANPKLIQRPKSPVAIPISAPMTTPDETPNAILFCFFMFNNLANGLWDKNQNSKWNTINRQITSIKIRNWNHKK